MQKKPDTYSMPDQNPESINDPNLLLEEEDEGVDVPTESRISKTLSERTTKIVIILVLLMLFF